MRDVNEDDFYAQIAVVREKLGDRAVLRAIHIFDENMRALNQKEALKNNDFDLFLKLINESGNSSYKYLQNVYSVSSVNEQGISLGLALSERILNGKGACRVHGGGFAGTVQCFVPNEILDTFKHEIEKTFGKGSCYVLNIRSLGGYCF